MPDSSIPDEQSKPAERPKPVAVFYGASSRHARTIAERVGDDLRARGLSVQMHSVWGLEPFDLGRCAAAMIVAAVHRDKHENAMVEFVKAHRTELERMPVAFISTALGEAESRPFREPPQGRAQFEGDVQMANNPFFAETGWRPMRMSSFAGAISYTRYNFFVRWMMKLLAPKHGAGAIDREAAGWEALDVFVEDFVLGSCAAASPAAGPAAAFAT
jgi:menaquinone-dependent protoporphyrinogen oxidase